MEVIRPWPWPTLEKILNGALAYDPDDRPTMSEIAQALDAIGP
jgi:hypothetical protein